MNFEHVSVMLMPTVDMLNVREGGIYVDGTLGGGGHSAEILRRLNGTGHLYGIDRDNDALAAATERLGAAGNFTAVKGNFHDVKALLAARGVTKIDGMMIDLGVSSYQLDTAERGFSYHADAPLDMRMDQDQALTAREIVNTWSAEDIARILREYSEEKWAVRIAQIICEHRAQKPLETTGDLVACVDAAIPKKVRMQDNGHSARRTFQALRIAVNDELDPLKKALEDEVNEKRLYCQRQANREFFGDSPAGVRQEGYLEEVEGLTARQLTDAYYEMLRAASIELIVLGCGEAQTEAVKNALLEELSQVERAPAALAENMAMPRREPLYKTETFDTTQAKLCMLFTLGQPMQPRQLAAVRLAMALYGGSVTSRLFLNVRERDHLCYYCSSSFQSFTGSMAVNSGVEHADAARAEKAVLKELADLCDGPITDEELEDCRRSLLSGMTGLEDTLGGIETWYYMEVLRGGPIQSPDEARAALCAVTKEDVRAILRALTLSVSYCLTREEGSTHA